MANIACFPVTVPETRRRPRFLLVSDDPCSVEILGRMLNLLGEAIFLENGREALEVSGAFRPDVILLEMETPEMDGFAVCAALKAAPELADVPILFVTAHGDVDKEDRALDLGALDFIHKPVSLPVVRARICVHLALKHKNDELREMARLDGLTGIANRRVFDEMMDAEWRRASRAKLPLSLLLVDLDYFKRYNDRYGHILGDDCLRSVAGALCTAARRPGDLCARYGGEEFAVILPDTNADQALSLASRIRRQLAADQIEHADSDVATLVTVSIGVATLVMDCEDGRGSWMECGLCGRLERCFASLPQALVDAAGQALHEAKEGGRDRACAAVVEVRAFPAPDVT
jgi:diguanylate cyclase (GGDEF)-like protein